jgi:hypothetical protein
VKRRQLLFTILKGAAVGIVADQLAPAQEDLDPVKIMPGHAQSAFRKYVRGRDREQSAGRGYGAEAQASALRMVYLADFDAEVKIFPDGKWSRVHRAFGTATWNEATVHEVKIVGNGELTRFEMRTIATVVVSRS